jgi:UDP:flavonoid glycosyltransferase YjiC (YdhE family)
MSERMSLRVLFVCFSRSSLGHLVRSTAAALELHNRGHHVLFAAAADAVHVPAKAGLSCVETFEIGPAPAWRAIRTVEDMRALQRTRLGSPEYLDRCIAEETALIEGFRPNVVVSDFRNSAGVSASLAGVPSVSIHNLRFFIYPMNVILPVVLETLAELGVADEHARKVLGDVMVVPDLSIFEPMSVVPPDVASLVWSLPREVRYVGPLLMREPATLPDRATLRRRYGGGERLLVNVTLGGSAGGRQQLPEIVAGLTGLPIDLFITTGPAIDPDELGPAVERFRAAAPSGCHLNIGGYRPDALDLMKACDVAVVHGGHGTTMEGLLCGTPMVFVPHLEEQRLNAVRAVECGTGVLPAGDDLRSEIADLVNLAAGKRGRADQVGAGLAGVRGTATLADFVETQLWKPPDDGAA